MLCGIITNTNVDYAELMWEEFLQAIQTFLADKANLGIATQKGKKTKPHVIPYYRLKKDHRLGNLKFIPKGEEDEHDRKIAAPEGGKKKSTSKAQQSKKPTTSKQSKLKSTKQSKPAPAKKPKVSQEKPLEPSPTKQSKRSKVRKVRKGKSPLKLINEDEEVHHEPEPQGEGEEYDVERAIQMSLESFHAHGQALVGGVAFREPAALGITQNFPVVECKGKRIATDEQAARSLLELQTPKNKSTTDQYIFQRQITATHDVTTRPSAQPKDDTSTNMVRESPSPVDVKTRAAVELSVMTLEERTVDVDEGHAISDPVHESLKHTTEEHVHLENPLSSSGTLSSMKNLDEKFGDQFFNDKPIEEPGKENVETEVEYMVIVPIHQASSIASPLSTPIINLSPPKIVSTSALEPIFTATIATTTTTLPLPPLPQQESITESSLASRILTLEQRCVDLEKNYKLQDKKTQALSPRISILELKDLPYKIDQTIHEVVKEPEHVALYEALEESMDRDNRDEFLEATAKSHKRRRDDQDPPPPPPDSDQGKKKRHDSDASSSKQPLDPQSSAWKTSDTREAPSSSSKQKSVPHSEQPVKEVPIPDDVNISDSEDTNTAHLSKIKTRPDLLKPIGKSKLSKADLEGHQERRNALSISKLKEAYYPDFRLEELVPSLWIESEQEYNISAAYGITHWWFKRKEFYITRHSAPSNRGIVLQPYPFALSLGSVTFELAVEVEFYGTQEMLKPLGLKLRQELSAAYVVSFFRVTYLNWTEWLEGPAFIFKV
ncbi:hypothetical protein Tco_1166946 [Tanacetum coccineum]